RARAAVLAGEPIPTRLFTTSVAEESDPLKCYETLWRPNDRVSLSTADLGIFSLPPMVVRGNGAGGVGGMASTASIGPIMAGKMGVSNGSNVAMSSSRVPQAPQG